MKEEKSVEKRVKEMYRQFTKEKSQMSGEHIPHLSNLGNSNWNNNEEDIIPPIGLIGRDKIECC